MKVTAETKIEYVDPLTKRSIKEGVRVTLTSDNGIIADFTVEAINKDSSIVLSPIASSVKGALTPLNIGDSVLIQASSPLNIRTMKENDLVVVQLKDGRKIKYWVDHPLRGGYLFLRPTLIRKKIGLLNRLSLVQRSLLK